MRTERRRQDGSCVNVRLPGARLVSLAAIYENVTSVRGTIASVLGHLCLFCNYNNNLSGIHLTKEKLSHPLLFSDDTGLHPEGMYTVSHPHTPPHM